MTSNISYDDSDSFRWTDIVLGIFFFLGLVGIGLAIAVNFRPLYYWNIDNYGLEEVSGLDRETIIENYDALIDYCSPFYFGELHFPTLKSSLSGLSHFAEVKVLFNIFYITGLVSIILVTVGFITRHRDRVISHLKMCAIVSVVIPIILVVICIIDFDALFIAFHKIAFNNNDWIFDPSQDPVINILPEDFFMLCLIVIAFTVIIGAVTVFIIYLKKKSKKKQSELIPKQRNFYY